VLFAPNYLFPPLFRFARGARVAMVHDLGLFKVPWAVRPDSGEALREGLERTLFTADLLLTRARRCGGSSPSAASPRSRARHPSRPGDPY